VETRSQGEKVTQALLDLLKKLVRQEAFFLITNQSLYELLRIYEQELIGAMRRGEATQLLKTWSDDVPMFAADWLRSPFASEATYAGGLVKVVTESATNDASRKCAERKEHARRKAKRPTRVPLRVNRKRRRPKRVR
jgi:hypothetical protein